MQKANVLVNRWRIRTLFLDLVSIIFASCAKRWGCKILSCCSLAPTDITSGVYILFALRTVFRNLVRGHIGVIDDFTAARLAFFLSSVCLPFISAIHTPLWRTVFIVSVVGDALSTIFTAYCSFVCPYMCYIFSVGHIWHPRNMGLIRRNLRSLWYACSPHASPYRHCTFWAAHICCRRNTGLMYRSLHSLLFVCLPHALPCRRYTFLADQICRQRNMELMRRSLRSLLFACWLPCAPCSLCNVSAARIARLRNMLSLYRSPHSALSLLWLPCNSCNTLACGLYTQPQCHNAHTALSKDRNLLLSRCISCSQPVSDHASC